MHIDKKIIGSFVLGIFMAVFLFQAFTIYQLRDVAWNNQATLVEVINFLNSTAQQGQPGLEQDMVIE